MPQLPASTVRTLRPQAVQPPALRGSNALAPEPTPGPVAVPAPVPAPPKNTVDLDVIGPRKLIRPVLPEGARRARQFRRDEEPALSARVSVPRASVQESSHAESFYLQKQMQTQTSMVFILDDNERIEGCIEWYDHNAIKVRGTCASSFRNNGRNDPATRILIYKASIKYLYKAGENAPF